MKMIILIAVVATLTGCGTYVNIFGKQYSHRYETKYYGGVAKSAEIINMGGAFVAIGFIDLPLSFVGDTLTLPVVAVQRINKTGFSTTQPEHRKQNVRTWRSKEQTNFSEDNFGPEVSIEEISHIISTIKDLESIVEKKKTSGQDYKKEQELIDGFKSNLKEIMERAVKFRKRAKSLEEEQQLDEYFSKGREETVVGKGDAKDSNHYHPK